MDGVCMCVWYICAGVKMPTPTRMRAGTLRWCLRSLPDKQLKLSTWGPHELRLDEVEEEDYDTLDFEAQCAFLRVYDRVYPDVCGSLTFNPNDNLKPHPPANTNHNPNRNVQVLLRPSYHVQVTCTS